MTSKQLKEMIGEHKRWRATKQIEYHTHDRMTRDWLNYCDDINQKTIDDCIEIIEELREKYDKYYERAALDNAIRHLKLYATY